jgi:hypothetical protein
VIIYYGTVNILFAWLATHILDLDTVITVILGTVVILATLVNLDTVVGTFTISVSDIIIYFDIMVLVNLIVSILPWADILVLVVFLQMYIVRVLQKFDVFVV